jgi:hypothetical protein
LNICNRCFVESIEATGKKLQLKNYYWKTAKDAYPDLWPALQRVKLYRHHNFHLELNERIENEVATLMDDDLDGKRPSQIPEWFFVIQQCVLDGIFVGLQFEITRYS